MTTPATKPAKPRPDFPLFPHASGQWAKKIRQRVYYFGVWDDPDAALNKYLDEKDDRQAGRTPRGRSGEQTIADICNAFLTSKQRLVDSGELAPVTWRNYYDHVERLLAFFGRSRPVGDLCSDDFERLRAKLSKTRGAAALATSIQKVRTIFKFAFDAELIDRPVRFGPSFRKPNRKAIRKAKQESGPRMIEANELRLILDKAKQPMKTMILLGLNCGFGQTDVANLPIDAIDFKGGWIEFPRPKTAIMRRCSLWKETLAALRDSIENFRYEPKDPADAGLVFITKFKKRWVRVRMREEGGCVPIDSVNLEFSKLLKLLGMKRTGGFYNLRHVFRTIAGRSKDERAVDAIMGHVGEDMGSNYTERIDDDRLQNVAGIVREWLFAKPAKKGKKTDKQSDILPFESKVG